MNQSNVFRFELGLEKPDPKRALQSAFTIAVSYVIGGLVPLVPYMFISTAQDAMLTSVEATLVALLVFGYIKGHFTGNRPFVSALQTAIIGALASAAAYGIAKAVQGR
jgi:vacuolar iron transporter family protein